MNTSMNRMYSGVAILAALAVGGCSVDNSDLVMNNYSVDQVSSGGLLLEAPATDMWLNFSEVVQIYADTQACLGMTAPAPTVWFKDLNKVIFASPWGVYLANGNLLIINNNMPSPFVRNKTTDTEALRHEYVHHVLSNNGLLDESRAHDGPMFEMCGIGVNQNN